MGDGERSEQEAIVRFPTRWRNPNDDWTTLGEKITDEAKLAVIRPVADGVAPVLVEHWFYRGASAPERRVFDSFDGFMEYLSAHAHAGDSIWVWSLEDLLNQPPLSHGKCPAEDGTVPRRGAY